MEGAAKRRRLLGQAPGLSLRKLQQLLATLGEDGSGLALSRELNSYLAIETPFGALLQTLVLKCSDGSEFVWTYVHPYALLHMFLPPTTPLPPWS